MLKFLLLITFPLLTSFVALPPAGDLSVWKPFLSLEGKWEGNGEGNSGKSKVVQEFQFVLNKNFLHVKTKSVFAPNRDNPKGEIHEDMGFISYDKARKVFVFRQFHTEGFVNQYVLDIAEDGKKFVFTTEKIENAPPSMKARWTLKIEGKDNIEGIFELAFDGKTYKPCSKNKMKR